MSNRLSSTRLAFVAISTAGACAGAYGEEAAPPGAPAATFDICRFSQNGGGCAHFQGYVYVRPSTGAPGLATDGRASSDASLGGERLYLHVNGDEAR